MSVRYADKYDVKEEAWGTMSDCEENEVHETFVNLCSVIGPNFTTIIYTLFDWPDIASYSGYPQLN